MSRFIDAFTRACQDSYYKQLGGPLLKYVLTGDHSRLKQAAQQARNSSYQLYLLRDVWAHLGNPAEFSDEDRRAISAAVSLGMTQPLAEWLNERLRKAPPDEEDYVAAYLGAFAGGAKRRVAAGTALMMPAVDCLETCDGKPNAAGRFLLSLSDQELTAAGSKAVDGLAALRLLVRHAPQRLPAVAESFLRAGSDSGRGLSASACRLLLDENLSQFEPVISRAIETENKLGEKARVLELLAEFLPERYRQPARELNINVLTHEGQYITPGNSCASFRWLVTRFREQALPDLESHLSSYHWSPVVVENLGTLAAELGVAAAPGMIAALRNPHPLVKLQALGHLIDCNDPKHEAPIRDALLEGLRTGHPETIVRYIGLAGRWRPKLLEAELWTLFDHKSKPVRHAAARALGRIGQDALPTACEKLAEKKAAVRSAAVTLLSSLESPAASEALQARLDAETDEEVRDQILLALERVWEAQGRKITRKDVARRIERAADKLGAPLVKWLDEKKLPPLHYAGKKREALSPQKVRYLLYRQSRAREMRADVEAKPLYALIDRATSGDFALAVLQRFLASDMAAEDRWALATAGLLGDDRIVPVLMQQIRAWVDKNRGKLAEYAAQALALQGGDVALCAVDALSIRYRSKQKNIGKAAGEAFAEAAERLGISVEELGDRVVPWLGFEPGKPRLLGTGDKQIEVRIAPDFKLAFRDVVKGKPVKSLPAWVPAAEKNEFKDLAATLREVVKVQLARLENLMVRQFRWPVARWRELYLAHPLLFPFACRLTWGQYDAEGRLRGTFRALEDRTLTNERDESVDLPADATIGIVHPLELSPEQRQAWMTHLADYDVTPPFLQMERPVVYPADDEKVLKMSSRYRGTDLNGMTFKGRAERLGWVRGSVVDAGCISSYRKPFAGGEAILEVDGMYIGMDMYDSIKLQRFYFVKTGSVTFGSYTYDEPRDEQDKRLVPFAEVPAIVYSETAGDLAKIAGDKAPAET